MITLVEWLMKYDLNQGHMTESEWSAEFERFKSALSEFWAENRRCKSGAARS